MGRPVRVLDAVAGLLAAGVLVVGVLLLSAQLLAPSVLSPAGWGRAAGPGWARVVAHLAVGVGGELVVRFRGRVTGPVRGAADTVVILATIGVIAGGWWP